MKLFFLLENHDELSASELISQVRGLYSEMQERVTGSEAKVRKHFSFLGMAVKVLMAEF